MQTYIALLRGVNVSGKNKLNMAELKMMLEDWWKYKQVETYIQTGNIIFQYENIPPKVLATDIHNSIRDTFGYEVPVLVMTKANFLNTVDNNPFLEESKVLDPKFLHVTFLEDIPVLALVPKVLEADNGSEEIRWVRDKLYLYYPDGYGRAKMTNNKIEIKLKVNATTRNWRTCNKLADMLRAYEEEF